MTPDRFVFAFDVTGRVDMTCQSCNVDVLEIDAYTSLADLLAVAEEHTCRTPEENE